MKRKTASGPSLLGAKKDGFFSQATVKLFETLDSLLCCLSSRLIFHKTSSFVVTRLTCCSSQLDFYATLGKFERITVVIATGPLQLGSGDHIRLVYVGNTKMVKI